MAKRLDALLNDLLSTHPGDPANARYLVPLNCAEDEEFAHFMADAIYSDRADYFSDDIPQEQADRVYEQALIDRSAMRTMRVFSKSERGLNSTSRKERWTLFVKKAIFQQ